MSGGGGASSAWAVVAKPKPVAANAVANRAPARQWRRNPMAVARAVLVVVSWVWLVFVEVFMALIVHPAAASQ